VPVRPAREAIEMIVLLRDFFLRGPRFFFFLVVVARNNHSARPANLLRRHRARSRRYRGSDRFSPCRVASPNFFSASAGGEMSASRGRRPQPCWPSLGERNYASCGVGRRIGGDSFATTARLAEERRNRARVSADGRRCLPSANAPVEQEDVRRQSAAQICLVGRS